MLMTFPASCSNKLGWTIKVTNFVKNPLYYRPDCVYFNMSVLSGIQTTYRKNKNRLRIQKLSSTYVSKATLHDLNVHKSYFR